jgi:hypothetical protein
MTTIILKTSSAKSTAVPVVAPNFDWSPRRFFRPQRLGKVAGRWGLFHPHGWPCEDIMKIQSFGELMTHLGYAGERPTSIKCVEMARLTEQFRSAWNYGHAAGVEETQDEYHHAKEKEIAEGHDAESGLYLDSCTRECKRRIRL